MTNTPANQSSLLERCGFCGRYFIGVQYLSADNLKEYSKKQLDDAPIGYCPEAQGEDTNAEQRYITRDMAIDAGYPEMEGQPYYG